MITLDNGYKLEGNIENAIIQLNEEWTSIFILQTKLSMEEIEKLVIDNKEFKVGNEIYISDGYIKSIVDGGTTKTWIKLKYRYTKEDNTEIQQEITDKDIKIIEVQQQVTDLDLRLLKVETGGVK